MTNHPNRKLIGNSDLIGSTSMYSVQRKFKKDVFNLSESDIRLGLNIAYEIDWENRQLFVFCRRGSDVSIDEVANGSLLTLDWKSPLSEEKYSDLNKSENGKAMHDDSLSAARKANDYLINCDKVTDEVKNKVLQIMMSPEVLDKYIKLKEWRREELVAREGRS